MSALVTDLDRALGSDQAIRRAARARRAEQGAVAELARLLAREAHRAAAPAEARCASGGARRPVARIQPGRTGRPGRLSRRPLAAGRA
jgi:hypothetical protein